MIFQHTAVSWPIPNLLVVLVTKGKTVLFKGAEWSRDNTKTVFTSGIEVWILIGSSIMQADCSEGIL